METRSRGVSLEMLAKLAAALDCTIGQLIGLENIEGISEPIDNSYSVNHEYMEYTLEIIEDLKDSGKLSKRNKSKLLSSIYKVVCDYEKKKQEVIKGFLQRVEDN